MFVALKPAIRKRKMLERKKKDSFAGCSRFASGCCWFFATAGNEFFKFLNFFCEIFEDSLYITNCNYNFFKIFFIYLIY